MRGIVDFSLMLTALIVVVCLFALRELYITVMTSNDFERRCAIECSPSVSITPVINGADSCLCDEGHGVWRRVTNVI